MSVDQDLSIRQQTLPPREVVNGLIESLGQSFDLSTPVAGGRLEEVMRRRIDSLPTGEPRWGTAGDMAQVARVDAGPLDFYYRPHLFPGMDPALRLGHLLQFDLLPTDLPRDSNFRISAVLESYCHLSGDLFGWHARDGELLIWIADVSGHGVRAGMAAAVLYFLIDEVEPGLDTAEIVASLNRSMLSARNPRDQMALFATAFFLRLTSDGRCEYASAGHPPMVVQQRSGDTMFLESTGPPIGLLRDPTFESGDLRLSDGDRLCVCTDGLLEADHPELGEFGLERLVRILGNTAGSTVKVAQAIYRALGEHRDTSRLDDDLTFLVMEAL